MSPPARPIDPRTDISVNKAEWDYTHHAAYYKYRPNYDPVAIDQMLRLVGARKTPNYVVADVGAGTGNLTVMLLERGMNVLAIEPNAAMRGIGIELTQGKAVRWMVGTGEETRIESGCVDLFAMGSSFNTTDRTATLGEANRVLKPKGWFACMWNHRELNDDPSQKLAEKILKEYFPDYTHGTRREDQSDLLTASPDFTGLKFIEHTQEIHQPLENYIQAWKSVKNRFWDMSTKGGREAFAKIEDRFRKELEPTLHLTYTTRIWMVQKR